MKIINMDKNNDIYLFTINNQSTIYNTNNKSRICNIGNFKCKIFAYVRTVILEVFLFIFFLYLFFKFSFFFFFVLHMLHIIKEIIQKFHKYRNC